MLPLPNLYFQKSLTHAIVRQYENLGIKHLAKLCGHNTENHRDYIKNVFSLHKSFEFLERLCDSLHIALSSDFYTNLLENRLMLKQFSN